MDKIEKISKSVASKISSTLSIDKDREEVLAYGAFALIQTFLSILAVAVLGLVFGVFAEAMIISFSAAILRKFSGGVHASSPFNCIVIGTVIFGGLALLVKHVLINIEFKYLVLLMVAAFAQVFYIMFKYSPVGSANKPLKNETTKKRLKKQSLIFTASLLIVNIILINLFLKIHNINFLIVVVCISSGIVWQAFTLVPLGNFIIDKLDNIIMGTIILKRRTKH